MALWCAKHGVALTLKGECGLGRECVGILVGDSYPSYHWYEDKNGEVWTPKDAYHKHPCVAVLGRGEKAEQQLYEWLKWFDEHNFKIETGVREVKNVIELALGQHKFARMVKS